MPRKIYKTLIYRFMSIIVAFTLIQAITGDIKISTTLTIFIEFIKTIQHYVFEYLWGKVKWKENI